MTMTDPIADFLTRLRNANSAYHDEVTLPSSKIKVNIAEILKREGYITDYRTEDAEVGKNLVVGNLVYSLVLGMSVPDVSGAAIANLEVETLKHAKPTFHGDTIYAVTRVLDKKETSDGKRGIVGVETKGINQRGEEVCYFRRKVMVWKREFAPQRGLPYGDDVFPDE